MDVRFVLYNFLILFAIPGILGLLACGRKYREGLSERVGFVPDEIRDTLKGERPIWLHAVSVGEVIASIPILKKIKNEYPHLKIVYSTITATGNYTVRQKIPEADFVMYFPYDYFFIVKKVIQTINPCVFIHTETEIWPNFLWVLHRRGIPSIIINGRLSYKSSKRYKAFGWFFRTVFDKIAAFGVQSQVDYDRVLSMGVDSEKVLLTGNMKYDQNITEAMEVRRDEVRAGFNLSDKDEVFIAGSTHAGEEEIVLNVFERLIKTNPRLVLVLAPRHPERFQEVEKLIKKRGLAVCRKTTLDKNKVSEGGFRVMLLDTIGELSRTYAIGDVILVGGSLVDVGGHNILEPVVHKKPVLFGPWMYNFPQITEAIRASGAGIPVRDENELFHYAQHFLNNQEDALKLGEKGFAVIQRHQGATDRNMALINRFIKEQGFGVQGDRG